METIVTFVRQNSNAEMEKKKYSTALVLSGPIDTLQAFTVEPIHCQAIPAY